jgi:hypothetical protein
MTLRFPRVMKIRTDKNWEQCMTFAELLELSRRFEGRLTRRQFGDLAATDNNASKNQKKRNMKSPKKPLALLRHFQPTDVTRVEPKGDFFDSLEFCVMNGDDEKPKAFLEQLIHEYKGATVQYPTTSTFCIIAARQTLKVQNLIRKGTFDIVHPKWLLDCIAKKTLVPLEPRYMVHAKPETRAIFDSEVDKYGDSYTSDTTVPILREIFNRMTELKRKNSYLSHEIKEEATSQPPLVDGNANCEDGLTHFFESGSKRKMSESCVDSQQVDTKNLKSENDKSLPACHSQQMSLLEIEEKYLTKRQPRQVPWWGLFRNCVIYLDRFSTVCNPETPIPYCDLDLLQKVLVFYGARVTSTINDETTHIIVSENDLSRVDKLKQKVNEMLAGYEVKPIILLQSWVTQSCSQHSLLDETNFQISL